MPTDIQRQLSRSLIQITTRAGPPIMAGGLSMGTPRQTTFDAEALEQELRATVAGEVRFGAGDRALYASDASNYRMVPIGVVIPRDVDDVERAMAACRRHSAPLLPRGGGTGIPGQSVNVAVVLDFSKYMHRLIRLETGRRVAQVEPGMVLDTLRETARVHGLTFGPDPATHDRCTIGGMVGNNSCGIHSVMAGTTADNVESLDIVTYDGERFTAGATTPGQAAAIIAGGGRRGAIYRDLQSLSERYGDAIRRNFPAIPRRVSGYNLPALLPENGFHVGRALVGSEGTCATVVGITAQLVDNPAARVLVVLGYADIADAADHVLDPMPFGPIAVEAIDDSLLEGMKKKGLHPPDRDLMPPGRAWLLVEFGGAVPHEAERHARAMVNELSHDRHGPAIKICDAADAETVWALRESGLGASAHIPGEKENHEGWEDSAVPPERLGRYVRDLQALMRRHGYEGSLYGHFGQGCVHTRLTFGLRTSPGIAGFRTFLYEAANLVVRHGGSLSGEHGDGQARGELLPAMFDEEIMGAFEEFKRIWDPQWKMNPGKVVAPFRADENLRLGASFELPEPDTTFHYSGDGGSFAEATERCVGAGVCRRLDGGTMCPSYMVTREEKHSTRGRARLLNEMLRHDPVGAGWRSDEVKEALDLCLACKGCKGDCPVHVDVATYKAEFLSHYYRRRLRPRSAYALGLIPWWARLASLAPRAANFVTHARGWRTAARLAAGIAPERELPRFADATFHHWFAHRQRRPRDGPAALLWVDTFTNHFHPEIGEAAVRVLEEGGCKVDVSRPGLCCGRPLYDHGMLRLAKRQLRVLMDALQPHLRAGVPIVVLEPSCASVFRDELRDLYPDDPDAGRLAELTMTFAEFVDAHAPRFADLRLQRRALLHQHCHQKSVMKSGADDRVLARLGVEVESPATGCCGMAGAFGFTKGEQYDVSIKCGERVLLPAVRGAGADTLLVADGFSCREQIAQGTGRQALHLAQLLQRAHQHPGNGGAAGR